MIKTKNVVMELEVPDHIQEREPEDETSSIAANFKPEAVASEPQADPHLGGWLGIVPFVLL